MKYFSFILCLVIIISCKSVDTSIDLLKKDGFTKNEIHLLEKIVGARYSNSDLNKFVFIEKVIDPHKKRLYYGARFGHLPGFYFLKGNNSIYEIICGDKEGIESTLNKMNKISREEKLKILAFFKNPNNCS